MNDKNFLSGLKLEADGMVVFDLACNHYLLFVRWTEKQVYLVTI